MVRKVDIQILQKREEVDYYFNCCVLKIFSYFFKEKFVVYRLGIMDENKSLFKIG